MNQRTLATAAAAAALLVSSRPATAQDDGLHWFNDYHAAIREAKSTGKPILVEFRCEP